MTLIFVHLKLCLATATHNFKWLKITHICLIWHKIFFKSWCLNSNLFPNNSFLIGLQKRIKTTIVVISINI